jgi:hypothetical protein
VAEFKQKGNLKKLRRKALRQKPVGGLWTVYYRFWGVHEFYAPSSLKENERYKLEKNDIIILASILGIITDFIIFLETESEATAGCR